MAIDQKLTVILYADVVDYSRLTGVDELGTHDKLGNSLDLISIQIKRHGGKVVHYAGDAVLAEFPSVVSALRSAVSFQNVLAADSKGEPDEEKLRFRVGINLGEVIIDRDDIYGDGVNIAARLETLADAGGICISDSVFSQVKGKLDLQFEDMGDQQVKNIADPVHAYRVVLVDQEAVKKSPVAENKRSFKVSQWALGGGILLVALGILLWPRPQDSPVVLPVSEPSGETPLPSENAEAISIAVLPFINLSNDLDQDYFSDGMTEDLITDLSKISALSVISRTSSFAYKGKSPDIRSVAQELNVRFVLEGSVRKFGERVRINAQLIDATTGNHLWAERYDRDFRDIFVIQDEVRGKIVKALAISLTPVEEQRLAKQGTESPEAYDLYLKGLRQESFFTPEGNTSSRQYFEEAIDHDPTYAAAYAHLAQAYTMSVEFGWAEDPGEAYKKGFALAKIGVGLDQDLAIAHWSLARMYIQKPLYDSELAISELKKAIAIDPADGSIHALLGITLVNSGRAEESLQHFENALRVNPQPAFWYYIGMGRAQFFLSQFDRAIKTFEKVKIQNALSLRPYWSLAAIYGHLGMIEEAAWELAELEVIGETLTIEAADRVDYIADPVSRKFFLDGLRKAGVPEK